MPVRSLVRRRLDVYQILGAEQTDTWQELRRRYRARARELHPDVQVHRQGPQRLDPARATALFAQLQSAWAQVATPELRAAYDHAGRERPDSVPKRPRRPSVVPTWSAGPRTAVLLRAGPGDLHIAVVGGSWDLSLAGYSRLVAKGSAPPLLIGDVPPHREVREALSGITFAERHRLNTMVGLVEPAEERGMETEPADDDGHWKLHQLDRAMNHWAKALPARRRELPYAADLLLMGRLSLAGYELNLPHPAGLTACVEPRPTTRQEAQARRAMAHLDLRVPAPTLLLASLWSGDQELGRSTCASLLTGDQMPSPRSGDQPISLRSLAARRSRADHHDPLWGSVLDRLGTVPDGLSGLRGFGTAWEWLQEHGRLPEVLPWGEPLSLSGRDQSLSDAAARLTTHLVRHLLDQLPDPAVLVALQGPSIRLRAPADRAEQIWQIVGKRFAHELSAHLGGDPIPESG